jgi:2-polyprenyl-3-methyl-5-hydroxy-6-metoxy-1,4-benzoquinol methylase
LRGGTSGTIEQWVMAKESRSGSINVDAGVQARSEVSSLRSARERFLYHLLASLSSDANRRTEENIDGDVNHTELSREAFHKIVRRFGPEFDIAGKRVLEVGCGVGDLAICMAEVGAQVTAIDVDAARIQEAKLKRTAAGVGNSAVFLHADFLKFDADGVFDRIVALESFEHLATPELFLKKMAGLLAPGGKILSIWGPTWLSPFGAHMGGFTKVPWVHLLFPEQVVLAVRRAMYRPTDYAKRYEEVRGGLNRMTVTRFRSCVARAGLKHDRLELNPQFLREPLRTFNRFMTALPRVGEFFSHTVLCVLSRSDRCAA